MQGLNLNANPGIFFAGKLSHWLKGGMWVALTLYLKKTFPCGNNLLGSLPRSAEWLIFGLLFAFLAEYFKGFSRLLAKGFLCPWLNISVGTSFFCLSISPIKSRDWTLDLFDSQLPCKVGSSLTINLFVKQT